MCGVPQDGIDAPDSELGAWNDSAIQLIVHEVLRSLDPMNGSNKWVRVVFRS